MALTIQTQPSPPKKIALFWEGTLLRTFCASLFSKELQNIQGTVSYADLLVKLIQIEQKIGKRYALSLLAKRAYLSSELKRKLASKGVSSSVIEEIVLYFQEKGYVDDTTRLQRLVETEIKKGKSQRAIRFKLKQQKGVDLKNNSALFSDETALDHWLRKHAKKLHNISYKERLKVTQTLSRLGFDWDLIRHKVPLHEED